MNTRTLGRNGPQTSALGLGCMGMSDLYGPADEKTSIATIHAALEAGITLLDTGDYYAMGRNELLLQRALKDRPRDSYQLSVKFGALRDAKGNWMGYDGRPVAVRNFIAYSLVRLGTDYIDIYRLGRVDPAVPIEETVGAIGELIKEGQVRYVGLSEAGADTVRRAAATHPVADLQIEYSLISRGIEQSIVPACRESGVGITAYGVLSRGLLSGHWSKDRAVPLNDVRRHMPRFSEENLAHNLSLVETLRAIADGCGATVAQVAIAWVLSRGEDIVPLVGARTPERLTEALGALELSLSDSDLAEIEKAVGPAAGERYPEALMAYLDSERG
jgi:aryl-alcohol dehydrogenase-like predicted oxidoreductase